MTEQIDTSTSTALVAAVEKPTSNGNGRIVWPGGPAKKQYFSLPDNIIYYMATNPKTPEDYLKLAMSCKYFFEKKPLLIVARADGDKFCSSKDGEECNKKDRKCCLDLNLAKLTSKIWLTDRYYFIKTLTINALFSQKLYKCENAYFYTGPGEKAFDNFKSVASSFEKFTFIDVKMTEKNGSVAMLENILGSLPMVKEFDYFFDIQAPEFAVSTMKNICKLSNLGDLRILRLINIPELFDVKDFEVIIKKHESTKFWFRLDFFSSITYGAQLDGLCDTVIAAETCKCVIEYYGQDLNKLAIMRERYDN